MNFSGKIMKGGSISSATIQKLLKTKTKIVGVWVREGNKKRRDQLEKDWSLSHLRPLISINMEIYVFFFFLSFFFFCHSFQYLKPHILFIYLFICDLTLPMSLFRWMTKPLKTLIKLLSYLLSNFLKATSST